MKSNVADVIRSMRARAVSARREQTTAARIIAPVLEAESKRILRAKIYARRIPVSKSGRPLWSRTDELIEAEKAVVSGPDVRLENASPHARPRNDLGLPGHRVPKYTLSVQWQPEAVASKRAWMRDVRRAAVVRALNSK